MCVVFIVFFVGCGSVQTIKKFTEDKCSVKKVPYKFDEEDYEAIVLENSLIKVVILPGYGARIVEYILKSTNHNQFDNSAGNPGLKDIVGEYGESSYSAGNFFCMSPYKATVNEGSNEASVYVTASSDFVKVERTMTIYSESSRLNIKVKYTNLGPDTIKAFMVRLHPPMSIGGNYGANDIILIPDEGRVNQVKEDGYYKPDFGWWMGFDPKEKEAVILTFNPEEVGKLYLWIGGDSYNMEYMGKPKEAKKGDSVSLECNYFIVKSADEVNKLIESKEIVLSDAELVRLKTEVANLFGK